MFKFGLQFFTPECGTEFWHPCNHLTFATFIKAIWQQNKIKNYPVIETRLFIKKGKKIDIFKFKEKCQKEENLYLNQLKKQTKQKQTSFRQISNSGTERQT